jgi:hypothetical protein
MSCVRKKKSVPNAKSIALPLMMMKMMMKSVKVKEYAMHGPLA